MTVISAPISSGEVQAELALIAHAMTDPARSLASLIGETGQLRALVERYTRLCMDGSVHMSVGTSFLPSGKAISPLQAALCAREPFRTAAFIQGLAQAIRDAATPERPVDVLYAGCGPFALLALPLMAIFTPQQVQFTLLEVHQDALDDARALIEELGCGAHVAQYVCTDAATWRIPAGAKVDVIVSETMNTALGKEPQVSIMRNLSMQAPQAALVPTAIAVHLGAEGNSREELCADWGRIFEINAASIIDWQALDGPSLPAATIRLPDAIGHGPRLLTRIRVYGDIALGDYECSLNLPLRLPGKPQFQGGEMLAFSYQLGSAPGLAFEVLQGKTSAIS